MALRMLGYVAAPHEELERLEECRGGKVPAVVGSHFIPASHSPIPPAADGQPGAAGDAALRGMLQETSVQLRCVLAICDQGLGSCAVGAVRELDGPVHNGPPERLPIGRLVELTKSLICRAWRLR